MNKILELFLYETLLIAILILKGLANPRRPHGELSMSTNVTGFRAHRSPQNLEMDLAWQELMAITDLQVCLLEHMSQLMLTLKKSFWENTSNAFYIRCPNKKSVV